MLTTLERDNEEEGGRDKCDDEDDNNNNNSFPIVELTNTNRMELIGINIYISEVIIPAMAREAMTRTSLLGATTMKMIRLMTMIRSTRVMRRNGNQGSGYGPLLTWRQGKHKRQQIIIY